MKKLTLLILILFTGLFVNAQKKFEFGVSAKLGYYFPKNDANSPWYPENTISPGGGISLGYSLFDKTKLVLGIEGNYLHPKMIDYWNNQLDVKWHSLNIPFYIAQGIGSHFLINGGVTLVRQLSGYWNDSRTYYRNQKLPEYNWQAGLGWDFNKIKISINYTRGFKTVEKKIKTSPNSSFDVDVRHQEIFFRIEYPLWKF